MNLQETAKTAKMALLMSGPMSAFKILSTLPGVSFPEGFALLPESEQRKRITGALKFAIEEDKPSGKPKSIYNSLDEVFEDAQGHQVTGQKLLNGHTHICGQWQQISLSGNLREQVISAIAETIGGREKTKTRIYSILRYGRPQHWAFSRFFVEKYGESPARLRYCAGQDQSWEMRSVRKELSK